MLNLLIKFCVNPFVDIALTFPGGLFNSFLTSVCFVLFEVKFFIQVF